MSGNDLTLTVAEQLLAIEEIKRVFAARLRVMDNKQWERYPGLHTEDVVSETFRLEGGDHSHLPPAQRPGAVVGREPLKNMIQQFLDGAVTVTSAHHGHNPEITLTSDTTATGIWAMEDMIRWDDPTSKLTRLDGYGHYHETYEKVDGEWRIKTTRLDRLRVDRTPR